MNYKKIYEQLCQRSQTRDWKRTTHFYEKHHIVPKSLGGNNHKSNIAILTPREHALAHLLLIKFLTGNEKAKMIFALKSMINYRNKKRQQLSSRQYESLRTAFLTFSNTPEYKLFKSEMTKAQWTPERRAAVAEKTKQQWKNNSIKRDFFKSKEWKEKQSKNRTELWKDPEYRKMQSEKAKAQWAEGGSLRKKSNSSSYTE